MLTFAEQLAQLEKEIVRMSGLTLEQFDELTSYISRVSAMTGLSIEDVTQVLQGASAHTGISMSNLAKTLEDLVLEIKEKKEEEDMPYRYKKIGNYKGSEVQEVSLNDYVTAFLDNQLDENVCYVISEDQYVVKNGWTIGTINITRRNIFETPAAKHESVRKVYAHEFAKRVPRNVAGKMTRKGGAETLISSRPAVAVFVREGENKLKEQARRGRELVEALKRS